MFLKNKILKFSQIIMHETFSCITKNMEIVSPKQYVMNVKSKSKGVLLDEFLHIIYELKVYEKKLFHCIYFGILWSTVKSNINKQFYFLNLLIIFFFLLEKKVKNIKTQSKLFFGEMNFFFDFDLEEMKFFREDSHHIKDVFT